MCGTHNVKIKFLVGVVDFDPSNLTQYFFNKRQECSQINDVFSVGVGEYVTMRAGSMLFLTRYLAFP